MLGDVLNEYEATMRSPARLRVCAMHFLRVLTLMLAMVTLAYHALKDLNLANQEDSKMMGSLDTNPTTNVQRRRLIFQLFSERHKKPRKTFLPHSSAHKKKLRGPFYPYNISGSYKGTGNLNWTQNGNSSWMSVTSYLRIKTAVTGSRRYHATQIQIKLDPVIDKRHAWTESDGNPKFLLLTLGIYDSMRGRIQAIANSPTYPPELPMFKQRNVRYPNMD